MWHREYVPGSIPAGAGEPGSRTGPAGAPRVYPRGCGGASHQLTAAQLGLGLSPRVRGSRRMGDIQFHQCGSIPAGAGEPTLRWDPLLLPRVYPRGCGGADAEQLQIIVGKGLSPRVRGSLEGAVALWGGQRSIPAGAGEPMGRSTWGSTSRVYPRGCGGASPTSDTPFLLQGLSPRVRGSQAWGQPW